MKLLKTRLHCPKCKGDNLNLVECGTFTTTFRAEAGVFDREFGIHEPEGIDRIEAHCRDCGHAWKPRGALQIDDVAIDPFGLGSALPTDKQP